MKCIWKAEKNETLKSDRGTCFEDALQALGEGGFRGMSFYQGSKKIYQGQIFMRIEFRGETWRLVMSWTGSAMLLRTFYPIE